MRVVSDESLPAAEVLSTRGYAAWVREMKAREQEPIVRPDATVEISPCPEVSIPR